MGRKESRLVNRLSPQRIEKRTAIATDMFLPNHSGIARHPEALEAFVARTGDSMTGNLLMTNSASVNFGDNTIVYESGGITAHNADNQHDFDIGGDLTLRVAENEIRIPHLSTAGFVKNATTGIISGGNSIDISDDTNLVAGTSLTLSGDTLNVDDDFVKIVGDVMTGSLIIVSASTPNIAVLDTTNNVGTAMLSTNTQGSIGTSTSHPLLIQTNSTAAWTVDTSQVTTFTGGGMILNDNLTIALGTGSDATLTYDGTNLTIDAQAVGSGHIILHSPKTTTGDPTGIEGKLYWNTIDNVIKMYADGAWRTLASW